MRIDNLLTETETDTGDATIETERLRERIEETRRGMGETIDAIQEKLSFSNISEQVEDQVSEQIGSAVHSVRDAAMEKVGDFMQVFNKGIKSPTFPSAASLTECTGACQFASDILIV